MRQTVPVHPAQSLPDDSARRHWQALLNVVRARRGERTVATGNRHLRPLRVQKILYPESAARAQILVLHPPGGIAGGDELTMNFALEIGAAALVTTPGAAKWYRSNGYTARQHTVLNVAAGAELEWLPQEAIVFDGAQVQTKTSIHCHSGARFCGWELLVLGRHSAGEQFRTGGYRGATDLRVDGLPVFADRLNLLGDDPLLRSAIGWNGAHASATLWACGLPPDETLLDTLRAFAHPQVALGISRFPDSGLLLARGLSVSVEALKNAMTHIWCTLRPALIGQSAQLPRIWAT